MFSKRFKQYYLLLSIFASMKPIGTHNYYVYITTNKNKRVLYTGVTNDLKNRLYQHYLDTKNHTSSFVARYNAYYLVYYEHFDYIQDAIDREKEIKGWLRKKKEKLITDFNPNWDFFNNHEF